MTDGKETMDHIVDVMVGSGGAVASDFGSDPPQGARRYDVTIRAEGHPDQTVEVHPHPMLDPERLGGPADEQWWWDVAGMAIVKAGEPWTSLTGVWDFHDMPGDSLWDHAPSPADVVVTVPPVDCSADPAHPMTHITITRLAGRDMGGTDGLS